VRRFGLGLALFTLAAAVVATQWPFAYDLHGVAEKWSEVDWRWVHRHADGRVVVDRDFIQNVLMLIPLGVGFALWRRGPAWRIVVEALTLGIAAGVCLEAAQLLTPHRFTQLCDAWRNAAGCLIGAISGLLTWGRTRSGLGRLSSPPSTRTLARAREVL
jgi:hypothetical protein